MFVLGGVLWMIAVAAANVWFQRAQVRYLRIYRERVNPPFPLLPEEWGPRYLGRPLAWLVESPRLFWRLRNVGREHHRDIVLEKARVEARRRWWVLVAVTFGGGALPVLFSMLSRRW